MLAPVEARLSGLLAAVAPAARRALARAIAIKLRASQAQRIGQQQNPDGSAFEPRRGRLRSKKGFVRRKMFSKIRTSRWLKIEASPESAVVAFAGQVQRMAQVHQGGLRDKVNRRGGPEVTYPKRELLGLTDADIEAIEDAVLAQLAAQ